MPLSSRTTYQIGLIQAQAYRGLQGLYRQALEPFELTIPEWSVLGLLKQRGRLSLGAITEAMQGKASHSTVLVKTLAKRRLVRRLTDPKDRRIKSAQLTVKGELLVATAEEQVRTAILLGLSQIDRSDLETYFNVLKIIASGDSKQSVARHEESSVPPKRVAVTVGCSDFNQLCTFRITADTGQEDMLVDVATIHAMKYHPEFGDSETVFRDAIRGQIKALV